MSLEKLQTPKLISRHLFYPRKKLRPKKDPEIVPHTGGGGIRFDYSVCASSSSQSHCFILPFGNLKHNNPNTIFPPFSTLVFPRTTLVQTRLHSSTAVVPSIPCMCTRVCASLQTSTHARHLATGLETHQSVCRVTPGRNFR